MVHAFHELSRAGLLVLLVVADQLSGDTVVLEQGSRATGVLARDQVGLAQGREHAQRDVLEVADRRRAHDQLALRHQNCSCLAASPSSASAAAPTMPASCANCAATTCTTS